MLGDLTPEIQEEVQTVHGAIWVTPEDGVGVEK